MVYRNITYFQMHQECIRNASGMDLLQDQPVCWYTNIIAWTTFKFKSLQEVHGRWSHSHSTSSHCCLMLKIVVWLTVGIDKTRMHQECWINQTVILYDSLYIYGWYAEVYRNSHNKWSHSSSCCCCCCCCCFILMFGNRNSTYMHIGSRIARSQLD